MLFSVSVFLLLCCCFTNTISHASFIIARTEAHDKQQKSEKKNYFISNFSQVDLFTFANVDLTIDD